MKNSYTKIFKTFTLFSFIAFNCVYTFAASCNIGNDDPDASFAACVLLNIINLAIAAVSIVFLALVAYGAIKLAMAFGDPKGMAGAQHHWTYMIIGTIIVLGSLAIFTILGSILGTGSLSPSGMVGAFQSGVQGLIDFAKNGTGNAEPIQGTPIDGGSGGGGGGTRR